MSAPNFYNMNASRVYIVGEEDLDYDLIREAIQAAGESQGWSPDDSRDRERNYPGTIILEKHFAVVLCADYVYRFTAQIIIRSGYYAGANLDYQIKGDAGDLVHDWDSVKDFAEDEAGAVGDDLVYRSGWSRGLAAMQKKNFAKKLAAAVGSLTAECEKFMAENCSEQYSLVGVFSNGEAVYERI